MTQWRQVQMKEKVTTLQDIQYTELGADTVCEAGVGNGPMVVGRALAAMSAESLLFPLITATYVSAQTLQKNNRQLSRMEVHLYW